MQSLIIVGTSRPCGNTMLAVRALRPLLEADVVDLSRLVISTYDYAHANEDDDFLELAEQATTYDHLVFATPLYWYTMSAQMKIFLDRWSDLITIRKPLGRALAGKSGSVLVTGNNEVLPPGFEEPFRLTCHYFGMRYDGCLYCHFENDLHLSAKAKRGLKDFAATLHRLAAAP